MQRLPRFALVPLVAFLVLVLVPQTAVAGTLSLVEPAAMVTADPPAGPARHFFSPYVKVVNDTYVEDFTIREPWKLGDVSCEAKMSFDLTESIGTPGTADQAKIRVRNGVCFSPIGEVWGPAGKIKTAELEVTGKTPAGGACRFVGPAAVGSGSGKLAGYSFDGSGGEFDGDLHQTGVSGSRCQPERWSITVKWSKTLWDGSVYFSGDVTGLTMPTITAPAPTTPVGNKCEGGTPLKVEPIYSTGGSGAPNTYRKADVKVLGEGLTGSWNVFALYKDSVTGTILRKDHGRVQNLNGAVSFTAPTNSGWLESNGNYYYTNVDRWTLIGAQVYRSGPTPEQSLDVDYMSPGQSADGTSGRFGIGVTNPAACRFWFGPKQYDVPTSAYDEPYGTPDVAITPPVTAVDPALTDPTPTKPTDPKESPCTFKISDPSTYVSGAMCAVAGLLGALLDLVKDLLSAVTGLPAELIRLLGGLVEELIIPTQPLSDRMTRMKTATDGKAPFSWAISAHNLPGTIPGAGCPDWRIKVANVNKNIICGTPFGNAMRGARPIFAVLLIGAAFWPMIRSVLYASFPVVKPAPVSS